MLLKYSWHLNNGGVRGPDPHTFENLPLTVDSVVKSLYPGIQPTDQLWIECSIFDLQLGIHAWEYEDTVFHLWWVASVNTKPLDLKGHMYLLKKICI